MFSKLVGLDPLFNKLNKHNKQIMYNKTMQIGCSENTRQALETGQKNQLILQKQTIRIPFMHYSGYPKMPNKSPLFSGQSKCKMVQIKQQQLIERLKTNQFINGLSISLITNKQKYSKRVQVRNNFDFLKTKSVTPAKNYCKIESLSKSINAKIKQIKNRAQIENQYNSIQDNYIHRSKKVDLPLLINMEKIRKKKKMNKKPNQEDCTTEQKSKRQMIRKCYSIDMSKYGTPMPSRRQKTEEEMENEYIMERIILAKPSKELARCQLSQKYQRHKYYKQIRQKKSIIFSPKTYLLGHSKSIERINSKDFIKI